jgi:hypothetical protein
MTHSICDYSVFNLNSSHSGILFTSYSYYSSFRFTTTTLNWPPLWIWLREWMSPTLMMSPTKRIVLWLMKLLIYKFSTPVWSITRDIWNFYLHSPITVRVLVIYHPVLRGLTWIYHRYLLSRFVHHTLTVAPLLWPLDLVLLQYLLPRWVTVGAQTGTLCGNTIRVAPLSKADWCGSVEEWCISKEHRRTGVSFWTHTWLTHINSYFTREYVFGSTSGIPWVSLAWPSRESHTVG